MCQKNFTSPSGRNQTTGCQSYLHCQTQLSLKNLYFHNVHHKREVNDQCYCSAQLRSTVCIKLLCFRFLMVKARGWHQHYSEPELKTAKSLEKKNREKKRNPLDFLLLERKISRSCFILHPFSVTLFQTWFKDSAQWSEWF